jgi:hypothetical protein
MHVMHDFATNIHTIENMVGLRCTMMELRVRTTHIVCSKVSLYLHHGFYKVPKVINRLVVIIGLRDYSRSNNIRKTISFECSLA